MQTTRREFLKVSGGAILGASALGGLAPELLRAEVEAAGKQPPTLVALYLRGGADALNTVVPYTDPLYYQFRPTIGIPAQDSDKGPGLLLMTKRFGFHPAMRELAELYRQGLMAPIINAGSPHPTRSHFDAQDFMERAAPGIKSITDGWLNRFLQATRTADDGELRAVSLQPVLPRSLRGEYPVLAVPGYGAEEAMKTFESLYGCNDEKDAVAKSIAARSAIGTPQTTLEQILQSGSEGIGRLRRLNEILRNGPQPAASYPDSHLGRQFRDIAKLIKADVGMQVTAIDYNGWDHHAYQGAGEGVFANMLGEVSKSIAAFVQDLGPRVQRTLVLVMSEFGRTARENGNNGSDHGHGGYMMAVGGMVNGNEIYGKWTGLSREALNEGRDMPVHTDFRHVFSDTLEGLFGFRAAAATFFPEYRLPPKPVGFLKPLA